ncbi:MAG: hypothetical protein L0Z53_21225, partial [Acidobacteriales bacterium]|nr:hypothetical protein [Terriglobales bacterium]
FMPNAFLGNMVLTRNGVAVDLSIDFSAIAASTVRLEMYRGGEQVGHTNLPARTLVGRMAADDFRVAHLGARPQGTNKTPALFFGFASEAPLTIGDATFFADEVRAVPLEASLEFDRLQSLDVLASGVSELTFRGASRTPPPPLQLQIARTDGKVVVSWPFPTLAYSLVRSGELDGVYSNTFREVTITNLYYRAEYDLRNAPRQFFRLFNPYLP